MEDVNNPEVSHGSLYIFRKRGTYNTIFVPPAVTSCTFQTTSQNPVSYIQMY